MNVPGSPRSNRRVRALANGWRSRSWRLSWRRSCDCPPSRWRQDRARRAVSRGTLWSAILIVAAFLVNRNIYNSDNYRYLIFLLTPWAIGFGLLMGDLTRRGWTGRLSAWIVAGLLFEVMTAPTFLWYRDERRYVDERGIPVRISLPDWSELIVVAEVPRHLAAESCALLGSGRGDPRPGRVLGRVSHVVPVGGAHRGRAISDLSQPFPRLVERFGPRAGQVVDSAPRAECEKVESAPYRPSGASVVGSAKQINWRPALETIWKSEGRDPALVSHLQVVVP